MKSHIHGSEFLKKFLGTWGTLACIRNEENHIFFPKYNNFGAYKMLG